MTDQLIQLLYALTMGACIMTSFGAKEREWKRNRECDGEKECERDWYNRWLKVSSRSESYIELQLSMPWQQETQLILLAMHRVAADTQRYAKDGHINAHYYIATLSIVRRAEKRFSGKRYTI